MPNGYGGNTNGALHHGPAQPAMAPHTGTQLTFCITQPAPGPPGPPAGPGGFCSGILPGIRYPGGMYPFGNNGSFPSSAFPTNWNFSYNADVNNFHQIQSHPEAQHHIPSTSGVSGIEVVQGNVGALPHPPDQNKKQRQNASETGKHGDEPAEESKVADKIVEKVSSLLSDPHILKSALSKLQTSSGGPTRTPLIRSDSDGGIKLSSSSGSTIQLSTTCIEDESDTDTDYVDIDESDYKTSLTDSTFNQNETDQIFENDVSKLSRSNSGGSVDSVTTPLKVIQKDTNTGDYIVRMSPDDFDRLNQGRIQQSNQSETNLQLESAESKKCRRRLMKRIRSSEERERMAVSQKKYYANKKETDPDFMERNREKTRRSRQKAAERTIGKLDSTVSDSLEQSKSGMRIVKFYGNGRGLKMMRKSQELQQKRKSTT